MFKTRSLPDCGRVTYRAILRQSSGHMVRILRSVVITEVTRHTGLVQTVIDAACMAAVARQRRMAARKRELRRR